MPSAWDHLEARWPAVIGGRHLSYGALRQEMQDFLSGSGVAARAFSHYGVVVAGMDASLAVLSELIGSGLKGTRKEWVVAYGVYVARAQLEGTELELIEPAGVSFFSDFLNDHGEGLQHLSFRVADIDNCLRTLGAMGTDLIDEKARAGSHGKVAFVKPRQFDPLYLELCQPV